MLFAPPSIENVRRSISGSGAARHELIDEPLRPFAHFRVVGYFPISLYPLLCARPIHHRCSANEIIDRLESNDPAIDHVTDCFESEVKGENGRFHRFAGLVNLRGLRLLGQSTNQGQTVDPAGVLRCLNHRHCSLVGSRAISRADLQTGENQRADDRNRRNQVECGSYVEMHRRFRAVRSMLLETGLTRRSSATALGASCATVEGTLIEIDIDAQRQRAVGWSALLDGLVGISQDRLRRFRSWSGDYGDGDETN